MRCHRLLILLAIVLGMAVCGHASNERPRTPVLTADLQGFVDQVLKSRPGDLFVVLKNGLRVLIREQPQSPVVASKIFVRAGSIYEDKFFLGGLSHYLEHVVSGGSTGSSSEEEIKRRLENIGGATNAYTSFDRTVYYIDTTPDHWQEALNLLLSFVSDCRLNPQEVEREKGVIQQEFKLGENNLRRQLWEIFMQTAYQVSPVREPVIGVEEVFVRQDRSALEEYYSTRYQPQNMVVVVAGNIQAEEVLKFVAEATKGFVPRSGQPVVIPGEPTQAAPRWKEKEMPMARLTQVMMGFPSVALTHPDLYALDVLAMILGDGDTSRLVRRLKDREQQVLSVSASNWTPAFVQGQFMISLDLAPQHWPAVLSAVEQEIDQLKVKAVNRQELEQAKKQVIAQHIFGKESASSVASSLGSSFMDTADPYFDDVYVNGIRQVTPEKIRDVAKRYLVKERLNVAVVKPATAGPAASPTPAPGSSSAAGDSAKTPPVAMQQLPNGLKLLLKADSSLPLVTIHLDGLGGLLLEDPHQEGIAHLTSALLTAGTKKRSKLDIARAIEGVGGAIQSGSANNSYSIVIKVLKEDLDLALDVLADIVRNSQFPEAELEKKRQDTLLAIQRRDENWQSELMRLFKKNYFHSHPYSHELLGTAESVKSFTRSDLLRFYQRMVLPASSVLAVYGDIDRGKVANQIAAKLAGWKAGAAVLPKLPDETQPLTVNIEVEKKNEKTSAALMVGTNGLSVGDAERPALDVLDAVLSGVGYPGGRLHSALRGGTEDLVYVVHAFPGYGIKAGYFGVVTQTTLANLPRVQEIILENLARLQNEPVPAEELERAKNLVVTMQRLQSETLGAQAQSAAVNEVLGLGWNYDDRYPAMISAVQPEDVLRVARKLFGHALLVRTIPEKPVEALIPPMKEKDIHLY